MNSIPRLIGTAVLALSLAACGGIKHSIITQPNYVGRSEDQVQRISPITSVREANGKLYVGGQKGLAALDGAGKVLWVVDLPQALVRLVDANDKYVAWTSYDITGLDQAEGAKSFFLGHLGDEPKYANATVGLASATDGKTLWSVKSSETSALSPPAISSASVGVSNGMKFAVYSLESGAETQSPFAEEIAGSSWSIAKGMIAQATRNRPVVWKDHYYAGFFAALAKFDLKGKSLFNKTNFGLFSPFEDITAGPVVFKEKLIFGVTPTQKRPTIFGATEEPDKDWKEYIDDELSGPGSIAANSNNIIIATNFHVTPSTRRAARSGTRRTVVAASTPAPTAASASSATSGRASRTATSSP